MTKFPAAGLALLCLTTAAPALACSSCGCNLTSEWLSQGLVVQPGTSLDLRYDDVPQTQLRAGRGVLDGKAIALPADREIERYTYNHYVTAILDRQFDPVWGVDVQVPFVYRPHLTVSPGDTEPSSSRTGGLGDIRVTGRWQGFGGPGITGIQFGLKLPTGNFREEFIAGPSTGEATDRGLQPGTGTIDATIGAYHFGQLARGIDFVLQAQATLPLDNRDLYSPGIAGTASAGVHFTGWRGVTPQVQLNARLAERDHGVNSDRENSGGEFVSIAPGATVAVGRRAAIYTIVQVPVYQRVGGYQLTPRYTLSVGAHYRL
ncbi:transporter [Polymorphobacter megasporae]|uniref:transporter n=1 Tax=Glacieibacterium megasporae TaxID=2835787 RepID=UPI001C1DEE5A|nr:transporter [Polymorphobacter megasporae]UAJ10253.1 transporter [Polymorphobacter megasporae]